MNRRGCHGRHFHAPLARVEGAHRVSLDDLGPGRHYVSVAPAAGGSAVVAAERLVLLEGAANFRDLGGYRTADGGRTRWGLVFRSDALHRLTTADLAVVGQLGLRVVYDLRREDRKSTRLNSSHTVISYAVFCLKKKKKNT